jgi:hypothetical protein
LSGGFDLLRGMSALAWDFDDTLVGHPAAPAMHGFIAATPQIAHHILTFRAQGAEARIWEDLAAATQVVGRGDFDRAINVDGDLAALIARLRRHRAARLFAGPEGPAERAWRHWKGMICAQLGAAALIDDRTEDVAPGCAAFGILHLHPDVFL